MWLTPAEAVDRIERGELAMLPPTIAPCASWPNTPPSLTCWRRPTDRDIAPVLPRVVLDRVTTMELLLPHEEGYES